MERGEILTSMEWTRHHRCQIQSKATGETTKRNQKKNMGNMAPPATTEGTNQACFQHVDGRESMDEMYRHCTVQSSNYSSVHRYLIEQALTLVFK